MAEMLTEFLTAFKKAAKKPHEFLSIQEELAEITTNLIKGLYDYTKSNERQRNRNTLPELIVKQFDEEQIWQQLELQNGSFAKYVVEAVSQFSAKKDKLKFPLKLKCISNDVEERVIDKVSDKSTNEYTEDYELEMEEEEEAEEEEESNENETRNKLKRGKMKPSIVDDTFFKLAELEMFLQNEEKKEEKPEKELLDLFDNTDNEATDYKYSDFFENPDGEVSSIPKNDIEKNTVQSDYDNKEVFSGDDERSEIISDKGVSGKSMTHKTTDRNMDSKEEDDKNKTSKKVRFSLLNSDGSNEDSDGETNNLFGRSKKGNEKKTLKSTFQERQERLGRVIEKLEDEALSEKPWQLSGEVSAKARPQNSLLEETVDFDVSVRPAPVMTEEVTLKLEDIITQRIKDKAWDDVERKLKPVETPLEFKKKLALDQEKSKLSLAEVYEQEFIKQRESATADDSERQEVEPALHIEVRSMLHSLFNKLDALSNYHYTPRPVAPELKVVSNVSAINMEEVAPVAVSDSVLLAPEEIKAKKRNSELMSKEERTDTDRKRARRLKKTKQRQRQRDKAKRAKEISKINPGLGNKYNKPKTGKELLDVTGIVTKMDQSKEKTIRSSSAFFTKLQDEVKNQIKKKSSSFAKKNEKRNITAKKLKL